MNFHNTSTPNAPNALRKVLWKEKCFQ